MVEIGYNVVDLGKDKGRIIGLKRRECSGKTKYFQDKEGIRI